MSENVAGWLGSSIGGVTYDQMGFENSTLIVIAMQVLALLAILYLGKCNASQHETNGEEEREKLLSKDSNGNYDSIDNVPVAKVWNTLYVVCIPTSYTNLTKLFDKIHIFCLVWDIN